MGWLRERRNRKKIKAITDNMEYRMYQGMPVPSANDVIKALRHTSGDVTKEYVDSQDQSVLDTAQTRAQEYAEDAKADAIAEAEVYTDGKLSTTQTLIFTLEDDTEVSVEVYTKEV